MQKLLQFTSSNQLIKEELQGPAILRCMTSVLMVLIIQILISFGGVSSYSVGPFKVGLTLDLF